MIIFSKSKVEDFFHSDILVTFPKEARPGLIRTFDKNIYEIEIVIKTLNKAEAKDKPVIIDYGCGLGINLLILSRLFNCSCIGIDRFDEFDEKHAREVGTTNQVIDRLKEYGVDIIKANPVSYQSDYRSADIVTSFDVIEHFNFPPTEYLSNMLKSLKVGGSILVGTPNQAHIFNRIKLLFGKNVWEDFDYWMNYNPFYGHVRELLKSELKMVIEKMGLNDYEMYQSSYPLYSRLKSKLPKSISKIIYGFSQIIFVLFPNLNYYNLIAAKKN
jgi:SAM-dependent methyltransferase